MKNESIGLLMGKEQSHFASVDLWDVFYTSLWLIEQVAGEPSSWRLRFDRPSPRTTSCHFPT